MVNGWGSGLGVVGRRGAAVAAAALALVAHGGAALADDSLPSVPTPVGTLVVGETPDGLAVGFTGAGPAQDLGPFGSEFRPTDPDQLFVSNAHDPKPDSGTVSAFTDSPNGTLSSVTGSPFADGQMAPCWVEITPDGQFLFTVNTASGSISRYRIASDGALTLLGSTQVRGTSAGAVDARLSPGGRFLYLDESAVGKVGAFAVNDGNLTELATSPFQLPAGAAPAGIVVT